MVALLLEILCGSGWEGGLEVRGGAEESSTDEEWLTKFALSKTAIACWQRIMEKYYHAETVIEGSGTFFLYSIIKFSL